MTLNLLYRAQLRNRDQDFLRTLGQLLASRRQEDGLREELWNYTDLYDAVIGTHDPNQQAEYINRNHAPAPFNRAKFSEPDLTDWIFTIQSRDATETNNAIHKWRQTGSRIWLLAALIRADGSEARRYGLIDASRSFEPTLSRLSYRGLSSQPSAHRSRRQKRGARRTGCNSAERCTARSSFQRESVSEPAYAGCARFPRFHTVCPAPTCAPHLH
jgi:hypothetical protein